MIALQIFVGLLIPLFILAVLWLVGYATETSRNQMHCYNANDWEDHFLIISIGFFVVTIIIVLGTLGYLLGNLAISYCKP